MYIGLILLSVQFIGKTFLKKGFSPYPIPKTFISFWQGTADFINKEIFFYWLHL